MICISNSDYYFIILSFVGMFVMGFMWGRNIFPKSRNKKKSVKPSVVRDKPLHTQTKDGEGNGTD